MDGATGNNTATLKRVCYENSRTWTSASETVSESVHFHFRESASDESGC